MPFRNSHKLAILVVFAMGCCECISQSPVISYLLPDIGTAGIKNTYIEIIGPYNQDANFGSDGFYLNNPSDAVRVVCVNLPDTNKIKIGPVIVSWNGKLISTQIFVMPGVVSNSANWQNLSPAYRIPIQVVLNNSQFSNADTFYIVQPQGAVITSATTVLGSGGIWGIRSRRGAMIVDSLVLQSGASVTVSVADCDPLTPGNQGYLPFTLMSLGRNYIESGAILSVDAPFDPLGQIPDAAAGGGGGGTESWTNNTTCGGGPNAAGNGFTGGGTEMACGTEIYGAGTGSGNNCVGCGIKSLNGVPGGEGNFVSGVDECTGAGGTGHPFGTSGLNSTGPGGYGGGTGWCGYAGGGYASDGTSSNGVSHGKAHGNKQLVPMAGGSGGSGGVAGPGTSRGGGGGGGGAMGLHAYLSTQLNGSAGAKGGNGVLGATGYKGGPGGSAGAIFLSNKLLSSENSISVAGGTGGTGTDGQGGSGGAGRVRLDGLLSTYPAISPAPGPDSSSEYTGLSTDTSNFVTRSFTLTGSGNGEILQIFLKPETKQWQLYATVSGYTDAWSQNIVLPCPDSLFLLVVSQDVSNADTAQYAKEPAKVFSQAAANILIVSDALKADAGNDKSVCPGGCVTLGGSPVASGGFPPYSYSYIPVAGLDSATAVNPIACPLDTSVYVVTVTDTSACIVADTVLVTVHPLPAAGFASTQVCLGNSTAFTDSSTLAGDTITAWNWNFGDGSSADTNQNPSHIYTTADTFYTSLIVISNNGCTDTITQPVVVYPLPTANFNSTTECLTDTTYFTDLSSVSYGSITSWQWDFGDIVGASANQNPDYVFGNPGTYLVNLTVTSNLGCTAVAGYPAQVYPVPLANFNSTTVCAGNPTLFTDASVISSDSVTTWQWNFGDGAPPSAAKNPPHTYTTGGSYVVTLIVTSNNGCSDTVSKTTGVYYLPSAYFSIPAVCLGNTSSFTDASAIAGDTIVSWSWNFGDGSPNNSNQNPTYVYTTWVTFNATLTVTSNNGCSDTVTKPVTLYPLPVANFSNTAVCLNEPTVFADSSSIASGSITGWQWDFGDGSPQVQSQSPTYIYTAEGIYNVLLTVTTNNGCSDDTVKTIEVYPLPIAGFSNTTVCPKFNTDFTDVSTISSGSITSWQWDFGNGAISALQNPINVYATGGTYFVGFTVTSNYGCSDVYTDTVLVYTEPVADFAFIPPRTTILNTMIAFSDNSTGPVNQWNWNFYALDNTVLGNDTMQNPIFLFPQDTGNYPVNLNATTVNGCSDDTTFYVEIGDDFTLFTPSAFTPNNDGLNDVFFPAGIELTGKDFELYIFDRWGDEVYQYKGKYESWKGWDGKANNGEKIAQTDVYVWLVYVKDNLSKKHQYIGHVTLVR